MTIDDGFEPQVRAKTRLVSKVQTVRRVTLAEFMLLRAFIVRPFSGMSFRLSWSSWRRSGTCARLLRTECCFTSTITLSEVWRLGGII